MLAAKIDFHLRVRMRRCHLLQCSIRAGVKAATWLFRAIGGGSEGTLARKHPALVVDSTFIVKVNLLSTDRVIRTNAESQACMLSPACRCCTHLIPTMYLLA